ncbi:hypothetical protein LCGC14_1566620 [marine sediment metagenome]|uniref:Uncharacterized protein n=1 Tax=marine sediment metagenome TaxID=412755 RepID=A0A0F9L1W2_9ZZZZ
MYKVCPHIHIQHGTPEERADTINKLPTKSLLHLLNCLPLDPLPPERLVDNGSAYMVNSLRMGISKVIEERTDV